jgi:hypothetical protein
MPYRYSIDREFRIVPSEWEGTVDLEQFKELLYRLWDDRAIGGFHFLVDMTRVERVEATMSDVLELVSLVHSLDDGSTVSKLAIVATSGEALERSRQYENLHAVNHGTSREARVFNDFEEARVWLRE